MLSINNLLLDLDLSRWVGIQTNGFKPFVQFPRFGFLLFFVLIDPLLDALGDETSLLLGLTGPLITLGNL